jgi:hypothetical protein
MEQMTGYAASEVRCIIHDHDSSNIWSMAEGFNVGVLIETAWCWPDFCVLGGSFPQQTSPGIRGCGPQVLGLSVIEAFGFHGNMYVRLAYYHFIQQAPHPLYVQSSLSCRFLALPVIHDVLVWSQCTYVASVRDTRHATPAGVSTGCCGDGASLAIVMT